MNLHIANSWKRFLAAAPYTLAYWLGPLLTVLHGEVENVPRHLLISALLYLALLVFSFFVILSTEYWLSRQRSRQG